MSRYRKFDEEFKAGAVRLVLDSGKPIGQVARDLGVNDGTLGNWVATARRTGDGDDAPLSESERSELVRLRLENTELRMQRDVLTPRWGRAPRSSSNWTSAGSRTRTRWTQHEPRSFPPPRDDGVVLDGVKATPSEWPSASLVTSSLLTPF